MKKSKKLMLLSIGAMSTVAVAAGAVSTMAWYQVQANAGIALGASSGGSLTTEDSTLDVVNYDVNFSIALTDDDAKLELSHVVSESEANNGIGGIPASQLTAGDLVYGGVYKGAVKLQKAESTVNLVTTYTVTASWASAAPTDAAEIAFLTGKKFTATLTATAQAFFVANAVSGLTNSDTATIQFTIGYDNGNWSFTPATPSLAGIHVEPANINATIESGTTGSVAVTDVSGLSS